jgi:tetratricopeptide (TPR) repeat protein
VTTAAPERIFGLHEVLRLLRVTPRRAAQLRRLELLRGEGESYRFRDLVALRMGSALLEGGATVRQVREARAGARRRLPAGAEPLTEVRLVLDGKRILVQEDAVRWDPRTGQTLLDLPLDELERETRESLAWGRVRPLTPPAQSADVWFSRASELDDEPERWEEAVDAYQRVLALDPRYAAAWNNLGLLQHRMGHYDKAGRCYREALDAEPSCVQAAFNLGALQEDQGDLTAAIAWYRRALEMDPDYADAHFNLAGALGRSGRPEAAAMHWRRYLELDLGSPWTEIARSHLEEGAGGGGEDDE